MHRKCKLRRHSLRWGVKHTADDAVIRGDSARLRASGEAGSKWRRAYGYMLPVSGVSRWAIICIDSSRGNQGMMYFGVSHVSKVGTCEWACSPFYGRLVRKCWNMDGALLVRSSPPEGFPDFHLKSVLCDEEGQPTDLDGRAASNVIELTLDADAGTLTFRLNGGPEGTAIAGFPPGAALRPVVALRYWGGVGEEDQVTIRGGRAACPNAPVSECYVTRFQIAHKQKETLSTSSLSALCACPFRPHRISRNPLEIKRSLSSRPNHHENPLRLGGRSSYLSRSRPPPPRSSRSRRIELKSPKSSSRPRPPPPGGGPRP